MPFGRTTQLFFKEGEQHEARQWEDVALPPDDEPEPKRFRGSVYKIPRQRGAMVALVIFAVALVVGVAMGLRAFTRTGSVVENAVNALKSLLPNAASNEAPPPVAPAPPTPPSPPPSGQSTQLEGVSGPAGTPSTMPATTMPSPQPAGPASPQTEPAPRAVEASPPASLAEGVGGAVGSRDEPKDVPKAEAAASDGKPNKAARPKRPRSNYVWSPEAKALVPVQVGTGTGQEAPLRSRADELGPAPGIAPAPSLAPAPERAAPVESDEEDPKGAAPAERGPAPAPPTPGS